MQNREVLNVETLFSTQIKRSNPVQSSEFDLHSGAHEVLKGVGLTTADSGGEILSLLGAFSFGNMVFLEAIKKISGNRLFSEILEKGRIK